MSELILSYEDVANACLTLAHKIRDKQIPVHRIVAVTRGGMLPACLLAQYLDIREIHALAIASYDAAGHHAISEKVLPDVPDCPETLFVDDLVDTGQTVDYIAKNWPNASFCAPFAKTLGALAAQAIPMDTWVVFPWEKKSL
ncbi:MAG: phosphoribosyltransferase [Alphaproteobacteria bacterium]